MATADPVPASPAPPRTRPWVFATLALAGLHFAVWALFEFALATTADNETNPAWWGTTLEVLRFPLFTLQDSVASLRGGPGWVELCFTIGNSLLWGAALAWSLLWLARRARRRTPTP